jgi:hypothetical protein
MNISGLSDIGMLSRVALSSQGVAALVCRERIHILSGSNRDELKSGPTKTEIFVYAAFNERGDKLYAWAVGGQKDVLFVWSVIDGAVRRPHTIMCQYRSVSFLIYSMYQHTHYD